MAKKNRAGVRNVVSSPSRVEAGIVEDGFEIQPNSETIADAEHIDHDALDEARVQAERSGAPHAGVIESRPSDLGNPYMSEEEQHMEMAPTVVGPPGYGSPDPTTSAGRLMPLNEHPLREEALPEGHPAAISEDYAEHAREVTLSAQGSRFTQPGHEGSTDLQRDLQGDAEAQYAEMSKDDLLEMAAERDISGRSSMNKDELIDALLDYDERGGNADTDN